MVLCAGLLASVGCASNEGASTARASANASGSEASGGGHHHGEGHGPGHEEHHPPMPPTVHAYHEVLRPLWHSDPGAERDARTCAQAGELVTRADAIVAAGVPAERQASADAWRTAATTLAQRSRALQSTCAATPRGDVSASLASVHGGFHELIEVGGRPH